MKFSGIAITAALVSYPLQISALEIRTEDLQEQTAPDKKPPKPSAVPAPPGPSKDTKQPEMKKSAKKAKKQEDKTKEKK